MSLSLRRYTPCHNAYYTTQEQEKEEITKVDWPPNSLDFNPIEHTWTLLKQQILCWRGSYRITSVGIMKQVLEEEWDRLTIAEINLEILKLLGIMERCMAVKGGNCYGPQALYTFSTSTYLTSLNPLPYIPHPVHLPLFKSPHLILIT